MFAVAAWPGRLTAPRPAGRTLIAETWVADENVSVIVTTVPTGNVPRLTQYPAGTVKLAPAITKVKFVPNATPVPATLHTFNRPTPPAVFVKYTSVSTVPIVAVTVRPATSMIPALAGRTLIADSTVPLEAVSVTVTGVPTGHTSAGLQEPPGARPAGTFKLAPATIKVNIPPVGTPVPAILQILRRPVGEGTVFRNVTIVCPPALTVTVAVRAARLPLSSNPAGKVLMPVNTVPGDGVSVIPVAPA